jgi:hypothetical protein
LGKKKNKERRIGFFGEGAEFGCLKARSGSGVFFLGLNQEKKQRKTKKKLIDFCVFLL